MVAEIDPEAARLFFLTPSRSIGDGTFPGVRNLSQSEVSFQLAADALEPLFIERQGLGGEAFLIDARPRHVHMAFASFFASMECNRTRLID